MRVRSHSSPAKPPQHTELAQSRDGDDAPRGHADRLRLACSSEGVTSSTNAWWITPLLGPRLRASRPRARHRPHCAPRQVPRRPPQAHGPPASRSASRHTETTAIAPPATPRALTRNVGRREPAPADATLPSAARMCSTFQGWGRAAAGVDAPSRRCSGTAKGASSVAFEIIGIRRSVAPAPRSASWRARGPPPRRRGVRAATSRSARRPAGPRRRARGAHPRR